MAAELFFYFLVYASLGWMLEAGYNRITRGRFRKDGLMLGPVKPMYGLAPVVLVAAGGTDLPLPWLIVLALTVPTAVELASGLMLERWFGRRYWDYSGERCQWNGQICLKFSMYWWGLSMMILYFVQPLLEQAYAGLGTVWPLLLPVFAAGFLADLLWTFQSKKARRGEAS